MSSGSLNNNISGNEEIKKSVLKNQANYINNSNIINENSSDNDIDNSNLEKETIPQANNNICEKELRRFTNEYIKVLSIYDKGKTGEEVNIKEILDEYEIPKEIIENKLEETKLNNDGNTEVDSYIDNKDEKIDFDNDIQPIPSMNQEMKMVIYLSKPKIIGFDGKLGLFYITPTPIGKDNGYNLVVKNPENMKVIFKTKIWELITCMRRNEKSIYIQNFGAQVLTKTSHEITFKNGEECSLVHQGINFLMNNKEDDIFY